MTRNNMNKKQFNEGVKKTILNYYIKHKPKSKTDIIVNELSVITGYAVSSVYRLLREARKYDK